MFGKVMSVFFEDKINKIKKRKEEEEEKKNLEIYYVAYI